MPHLNNKDEVNNFFQKAYAELFDGGKLIVQIINFNKFLLQKSENGYLGELPLIQNKNVKFERYYFLSEDENIIFKTVLDDKIENEEILLNISFSEIKEIFNKIGFKNINIYGGFNKIEFDFEKSTFLVMTAEK